MWDRLLAEVQREADAIGQVDWEVHYVADASIMPDCIRANTNVTTMMIGERIAEFIKAGK